MSINSNNLIKYISFILCLLGTKSSLCQEIDLVIGGKIKRNFHSQDEVTLSSNGTSNFSKELHSFNTLDVIVEASIIYRPKPNFFVEGKFNYGSDTYKYLASSDVSNFGYNGGYAGWPLGPHFIRSHGFFSLNLNAGYTINRKKVLLDLGAGLSYQPAWGDGISKSGIGIYIDNQEVRIADIRYFQTQTTHIYQNIFARLLVHDSKHKLFNHLGCELGYTNKLFGRFRKSVMDVTYTDSQNRTFVNKHYDFQRSLAFSILYRF